MTSSEAAIRGLLDAYCERLDAGNFDGVAELFRHGVFRSPRGTNLEGAAAVRSQYDAVLLYDDGTPRTKHVLGTVIVEVDDDALGTIASEELNPAKARVLLRLALLTERPQKDIQRLFREY